MEKKILIITSYLTGHGHKSITNALEEELKLRSNITYKAVEGFEFGGRVGVKIGELYAPIIRNSEEMWKLIFNASVKEPNLINKSVKEAVKKNFYRLIDTYHPDLILSVHPAFNGCILDLIEKKKLDIPFVEVFADLISLSPLWVDDRATLSIAPTKEAGVFAQKRGVPADKIEIIKLPVRKDVAEVAKKITSIDEETIKTQKDIRFLIMSGGEGSGKLDKIIDKLLKIENSKISIITGTNKKVKKRLDTKYKDYLDRITIYGFVKDIANLMVTHDIGVVRGSPNILIECVSCLLPVILTGTLPGQEEGNIDFILLNELGVLWHKKWDLEDVIKSLLKDNKKHLIQIKQNQLEYRDLNSAKKIIDAIEKILYK